ncbi:MAG: fumarylacetoacetase [Gemmatimonadota bacterium]
MIDHTHDPDLVSWVASANDPATEFPPQNLPFGVFRRPGDPTPRTGVAIGDQILDIAAARRLDLLGEHQRETAAAARGTLNALMALGSGAARALRHGISTLLRIETPIGRRAASHAAELLVPLRDVAMQLPAHVGDYSDFYASIDHATNVGSMFRPDNPLLPNYKWVPIGYHGRASSIVVSGTPVRRPLGQTKGEQDPAPVYKPTQRLDYEVEVGMFVGPGNALGVPLTMREARGQIFGFCLLNDWSARDVQAWEYQPLGPFLAKSFATTISPWIVSADALAPFRTSRPPRAPDDPQPLAYLDDEEDRHSGSFEITLIASLQSRLMRERHQPPVQLSRASFAGMYWSPAQLVAHHTSNGCNLVAGDLLGSGTVSGATKEERGCLLERTWRGTEPLTLPSGEQRRFLEDGDRVTFTGFCEREGYRRIGFGDCSGEVLAALTTT